MRGHEPFNKDIDANGRYIYTGETARKSAIVANTLQSKMVHQQIESLSCNSLLDLGCGDGTYTHEFLKFPNLKIVGLDPADKAIAYASQKYGDEDRLRFISSSIQELISSKKRFDLVVLRGVLHHCDDPEGVVYEASKVTNFILILEPNGLNPIMKIIEKLSPYHRAHSEKSFTKRRIASWLESADFELISYDLGILVPYFFPSKLIPLMVWLEPIIKRMPIIKKFLLGTQVLLAGKVARQIEE
jgi:2-polyprenyl-3-methyl-5-hydroxy-6-metoxy-1,4-benzoquinol methylase